MNGEQRYKLGTVTLYYLNGQGSITITGVCGTGSVLKLPESIDGMPVTTIGKKAFLGENALTKIVFPATVERIESWALAQCRSLAEVVILRRDVKLETGVFEDCIKLKYICMGSDRRDDLSVLLGALPMRLSAEYLLLSEDVGTEQWYWKWDQKLLSFLNEEDDEGYTNLVLCGEEDIMQSVPEYVKSRRMAKAALCFIRLMYHKYIAADCEKVFQDYILKHSIGASTDEAWQVLVNEFGEDIAYFQLFSQLGGIRPESIDAMLTDLGEGHAEAKAYLMKYQADHLKTVNVFDRFTL